MGSLARVRSRVAIVVVIYLMALGVVWEARGAESVSAQKMKADIQRKHAESKRKFEQQKREMEQKHQQHRQKVMQGIASGRNGDFQKPPKPAFNAANAPPPADCLKAFVNAARTASSMESLLRFLPDGQAKTLRETQAKYDPKQAASGRAWHKKQNPNISEETLTHLSNPPFVNSLKFHRSLANEIYDVLSVKVEGDEAKLVVSTKTEATIDGGRYPYSKANVEMVAEGNYWKLSRYQPSNVYYQELPTKP